MFGNDAKQCAGQAIRRVGGTSRAAIVVLGSGIPVRIVDSMGSRLGSSVVERVGIGLIHVVEAAQVHPAHVHSGDAQDGVFEGLDFKTQAGLRPVRGLVVLDKAHNHRLQRTRRVIGNGLAGMEQRIQSGGIGGRVRAKGRQPGFCV